MKVLEFKSVHKHYPGFQALKAVSFTVEEGEFTALAGPSGSGKTTILNLAAGIDFSTNGEVRLIGNNVAELGSRELAVLRRRRVGFVFQSYNLFPVLTTLENVEYPLAMDGLSSRERRKRAEEALEWVGLSKFAMRFPAHLSGGQQQRVAIARAIVNRPRLIFADEPTANLDSRTTTELLALFRSLNQEKKITFLFSSHDSEVLKVARRVIQVSDGEIKGDVLHAAKGFTTISATHRSADVEPALNGRVCERLI